MGMVTVRVLRKGVGDDAGDVGEGGGVADDELEDFAEVAHEDDEGKEDSAEEGVGGDFAEDVAGEDAHGAVSSRATLSLARGGGWRLHATCHRSTGRARDGSAIKGRVLRGCGRCNRLR